MKSMKFFATIFIAIVTIFAIQSCNKDNGVVNTQNPFDIEEYSINDYNFSNALLSNATLENDFEIGNCVPMHPLGPKNDGNGNGNGKKMDNKNNPFVKNMFNFNRIFRELNLSDAQKEEIKSIIEAHFNCEKSWFEKLQKAREEVLEKYRTKRQAIMEQVKNGEITRLEARELLFEMNKSIFEELNNLPINKEVKEGILACREEFFAAIGSILSPEQKEIWDKFINRIK